MIYLNLFLLISLLSFTLPISYISTQEEKKQKINEINIPNTHNIMPLKDIKIGMIAYFYSKTEKNQLKKYKIEILGISSLTFSSIRPAIIAKFFDLKNTGILKGMSGSPVFIGDKLIGAVAFGYNNSNANYIIGGVQPIEYMLEIIDEAKNINDFETLSVLPTQPYYRTAGYSLSKEFKRVKESFHQNYLNNQNLYNSKNIKEITFAILKNSNYFNLDLFTFTQNQDEIINQQDIYLSFLKEKNQLEKIQPNPGNQVHIMLLSGALNVGLSGTITYKQDNNLLLFGHGLSHDYYSNSLNVRLPIYNSFVISEARNDPESFLLSQPVGNPIGSTIINNESAVYGILGEYNYTNIPISISLSDESKLLKNLNYFIHDKNNFYDYIYTIIINALQNYKPYLDPVSLDVNFKIDIKNLKTGKIDSVKFRNIYSSFKKNTYVYSYGISRDLSNVMAILAANPFSKVEIISTNVDINLIHKRKILYITKVEPSKIKVKLGETINLRVYLSDYQNKTIIKNIEYKVQDNINSQYNKEKSIFLRIQNAEGLAQDLSYTGINTLYYNYDNSFDEIIPTYSKLIEILNKGIFNEYILALSTNTNEKNYFFEGTSIPNIPSTLVPILQKSYSKMFSNPYLQTTYFLTDHYIIGDYSLELSIDF